MKEHITQLQKSEREGILQSIGINDHFDYANPTRVRIGVSNMSNLDASKGQPLDLYLGPVSNAANPTALTTALPQYAVGYQMRNDLRAFLDRVAPLLPAGDTFQYKKFTESANFAPPTNDEYKRAVGARKFAEIKRSATLVTGSVDNKGLTIFADRRLGGLQPQMQQNYVRMLQGLLMLADVNEFFTLADANDSAASPVNWGASNTSANPDDDLLALVDSSGDALGMNPNVILMSGATSIRRKRAIKRGQLAGSMLDYLDDNALADFLEVDEVVKCTARYQSSASAKSKVGAQQVFAFAREAAPTLEDASSFKRPYDPSIGGDFVVFIETLATGALITVQHSSAFICASTVGLKSQPVTFT